MRMFSVQEALPRPRVGKGVLGGRLDLGIRRSPWPGWELSHRSCALYAYLIHRGDKETHLVTLKCLLVILH